MRGTTVGGAVARGGGGKSAAGWASQVRMQSGAATGLAAGEQEREALAPDAPFAGDQRLGASEAPPGRVPEQAGCARGAIKFEGVRSCRAYWAMRGRGLPLPVRRPRQDGWPELTWYRRFWSRPWQPAGGAGGQG